VFLYFTYLLISSIFFFIMPWMVKKHILNNVSDFSPFYLYFWKAHGVLDIFLVQPCNINNEDRTSWGHFHRATWKHHDLLTLKASITFLICTFKNIQYHELLSFWYPPLTTRNLDLLKFYFSKKTISLSFSFRVFYLFPSSHTQIICPK